jgi:hypothetical protein
MKADTIQDVELRGLLLKLESAFLTHQEVEELVDKVKRLEQDKAELVEALEGMIDAHAIPSSICKDRPAYEKAQAALAKAKREE